jgi:uncharacterized protein YfiM (DUF2279 family)
MLSGLLKNELFPSLFFLLICLVSPEIIFAQQTLNFSDNKTETQFSKESKLILFNSGALLFITGWGITKWDYGENKPTANSEHWFSHNTKEGGADKLGHYYSSYFLSGSIAFFCKSWGYSRDNAAIAGALSSFGIMNFMEVGDSFSNYGFAYEDFIMNTMGCLTGYLIYKNPELLDFINLRVEYLPDSTTDDFLTDYENIKYLIALKASGFDLINATVLKYFELQLGYFARGYSSDSNTNRQRNFFVGMGIDFSYLFKKLKMNRTSDFLNYYQIPHTSIQYTH